MNLRCRQIQNYTIDESYEVESIAEDLRLLGGRII